MTSMDIIGAYPQARNFTQLPSYQNRADDIEGAQPRHKVTDLRKNLNRVGMMGDNPISPLYTPSIHRMKKTPDNGAMNYTPFKEYSF